MSARVYYNEFDPYAAEWLRNLIAAGHLPAGDVDERDIRDVRAADLAGYGACHFFAGIGGWAYALGLAGWPTDHPVWTGSCPCQPLSSAGQRKGHADERHLWPAFHSLIAERRPAIVFGEQVAGADGREWLAAVRADLEDDGYAVGAADLCSAGAGATDIRQRLYWMADALRGRAGHAPGQSLGAEAAAHGEDGDLSRERLRAGVEGATRQRVADADEAGRGERAERDRSPLAGLQAPRGDDAGRRSELCGMADAAITRRRSQPIGAAGADGRPAPESGRLRDHRGGTPLRGFWADADWLLCTDGKARPVEPGTFPLGHGLPARVGRLRAYGNAINPWVAKIFIEESRRSGATNSKQPTSD